MNDHIPYSLGASMTLNDTPVRSEVVTMKDAMTLRRAVLFGAPTTLGLINVFHPVGVGHHPYDVVSQQPTWWLILHILQLPLFSLLGLAVFLLTSDIKGRAATVSRVALGFFVTFYVALDAITGVASGLIVRAAGSLSPEEHAVVEPLIGELFLGGGPLTFIPALAILGWVVAVLAAARALSNFGVGRLPVALLVVAAVGFGITHEPPFGPVGLAAFLCAAVLIELHPSKRYSPESVR
jgi:hypothetical protein